MIRKEIDTPKQVLDNYSHYNENHHLYAITITSEWNYVQELPRKGDVIEEKRRIYIHIYYNAEKATANRSILEEKVTALHHELLDGKRNLDHENLYKKYFFEKETPARGYSVTVRDDILCKAREYYGYFALISNAKMDAIIAMETYRNRAW